MVEKIYEREYDNIGTYLREIIPTGRCKKKTVVSNGIEIVFEYIEVEDDKWFGLKKGTRWVNKDDIVIREVTEEIYICDEN